MLKYLIAVTEDTAVMAVLTGLLFAYLGQRYGRRGRAALTVGLLAGAALSLVRAILANTTKILDRTGGTGMWNVRIFAVTTVALALFLVFAIPALRRATRGWAAPIVGAVYLCLLAVYTLPDVWVYPFKFNLGGSSVFSTAFIYRFLGLLSGVALAALVAVAVYRTARRLPTGAVFAVLTAGLLINGFEQIVKGMQVLYSKRYISGKGLFALIRTVSNNSHLFIYAALLLALVAPVWLWIRSFHVQEPYENPAQHRKIRAKWRSNRRWSGFLAGCLALCVVTLTAFAAIDSREVEIAPVESCDVREDGCYIPLEQVEDGHLHRFEYVTDNNVHVIFIVIKKPNSSSYGIGLDACDICGKTGYFERGGQIVCKLCDVVMNINTIGFKGGCNPIVIDYSIADGYIFVPSYTLVEHEKEFR